MIYSCFNDKLGLYEYFETPGHHPTNGDLPAPREGRQAGTVGVPAMEAGRKIPSGARRAGTGWEAKGIIVSCQNKPVQGIGSFDFKGNPFLVPYIVVSGALGYYIQKDRGGSVAAGIALGSGAALLVSYFGKKDAQG
jgi:hypothetical protein